MTDPRPDLDQEDQHLEPVSDDDVAALADNLKSDAEGADVRVDVPEASEHIGTGTDR
jgi:hypothetical protein